MLPYNKVITLSPEKMSTVTITLELYSLLQVLCCTQKRACARSSSPTLGLVQPSVGGPGPFSEGIPLLSGRGGQIFTGRGSLPFPFPSWQDEKVNLFFEGLLKSYACHRLTVI